MFAKKKSFFAVYCCTVETVCCFNIHPVYFISVFEDQNDFVQKCSQDSDITFCMEVEWLSSPPTVTLIR